MQVNRPRGEQDRLNPLVEMQSLNSVEFNFLFNFCSFKLICIHIQIPVYRDEASLNSNSILSSQVPNRTVENACCMEEDVLTWISIIQISAGYTGRPETLAIASFSR